MSAFGEILSPLPNTVVDEFIDRNLVNNADHSLNAQY